MKKRTLFIVMAALLLTVFFSGCGGGSETNPVEQIPQESPVPADQSGPEPVQTVVDKPNSPVDESAPHADTSGLQTETIGWYFIPNQSHQVPRINESISFNLSDLNAYYVGSTDPVVFLTFDEGYENGGTSQILDILKDNRIPAAFFVTRSYIQSNPDLVERMAAEGHLVCNHSDTHPSMPSLTEDPERFQSEIMNTAALFQDVTGREMPHFFRPPQGEYSEKSLQMTADLGYKTIFWSFAYKDWVTDAQPDPGEAFERITAGTHNGEIILLHAVSATNVQILDSVIKEIQNQGYRFASLNEMSDNPAAQF